MMIKNKNLLKSKRAQHEMVGFILIVVIVVIIGLILLVFYINQKPVRSLSSNVNNFLQASMLYTTSCYSGIEPLSLKELIKSCYRSEICSGENSKSACDVLNSTFSELIHEAWIVSPEKAENAYFLDAIYEEKDEDEVTLVNQTILSLQEGNCTGSRVGGEHFFQQDPGNIFVTMELCYT